MEKTAEASGQSKTLDTLKWIVGIGVISGAIIANSIYSQQPVFYRVLFVVVAFLVAFSVMSTTEKGRSFVQLVKDSRLELRKIVWPDRQDTLRTTLFVFIVVCISSIFLWAVDMALGAIVSRLIG